MGCAGARSAACTWMVILPTCGTASTLLGEPNPCHA